MALKPLKPKRCCNCPTLTTNRIGLKICCSINCAIEFAKKKQGRVERAKATIERKAHKEAKQRIKTRYEFIKEAQQAFNAFIRERDKALPCISCQRYHQGQMHAGHYRSTKAAPEIRFNEDNAWLQCQPCNVHLSGNVLEYRIELLRRIGPVRVCVLEGPHEPKKYTIEQLKEIKATYRLKLKELKNKSEMV